MHASHPRFRALAVGIAAFGLITVAAGGTLAASTNPPTLYACFNTSGQVAMATIPQCKLAGGGQLAYWSTQGVPGPTGPTGATGATGPTGAQGPVGVGSVSHLVTVPGDGQAHSIVTSPGIDVGLVCGGAFGRGLRVTAGADPVQRAVLLHTGDTFAHFSDTIPPTYDYENGTGDWIDVQAATAAGGVHVTVMYMSGSAPGDCTFLASW